MGAAYNEMKVRGSRAFVAETFERVQEQDRYENGHSYSGGFGMAEGLSFSPCTFSDEQMASTWLADNAQKWGPAIAVKVGSETDQLWMIGAWCSC